ncbi:type IX secretion system ring subunit PorN/GldN [Epilithonimonas caeni]|uniref:type IX secretion system ring protein PorN/GldN n=1 Tax=Epilithonimonas caeni TaxID=365343 RepID=UPI0004003431|nr:gliding motility protein GldN [Epilithonimonas caeni]
MKKIIYSLICLSSTIAYAQNSILNASSPQTFREEREIKKDSIASPLKYGFIEDKDILRSMVVWEIIDMNDKINQPFYHNSDGLVSQNKSLYQVLLDAVNNGKIKEVYSGDDFTARLTPEQIVTATSAVQVADYFSQTLNENKIEDGTANNLKKYFNSIINSTDADISALKAFYGTRLEDILLVNDGSTPAATEETPVETTTTTKKGKKKKVAKKTAAKPVSIPPGTVLVKLDGSWYKINRNDISANVDKIVTGTEKVKALKLMGMWYVDKRDSQLRYRLLGIAAMGEDPNAAKLRASQAQALAEAGQPIDNSTMGGGAADLIDLFWIYYPDARQVLTTNFIFNAKNSTSDITFDDVLNQRRFSSVIYKSDNGLGKGGSGVIDEYIPNDADGQLEESDRIKAQILQMENDMWNY